MSFIPQVDENTQFSDPTGAHILTRRATDLGLVESLVVVNVRHSTESL